MKEAVTKVIDMLTQENFHEAFQMLLERYNKYIAAGGDYFEGDTSFMRVLSIKVPIRKKSGNLFNDPRIYIKLNRTDYYTKIDNILREKIKFKKTYKKITPPNFWNISIKSSPLGGVLVV